MSEKSDEQDIDEELRRYCAYLRGIAPSDPGDVTRRSLGGMSPKSISRRGTFADLQKIDDEAARHERLLARVFERANTPAQRTFCWCPWCDTEMVSAEARHWWSRAERVVYLQCPTCKRRSRWYMFDRPVAECLDTPPPPRPTVIVVPAQELPDIIYPAFSLRDWLRSLFRRGAK